MALKLLAYNSATSCDITAASAIDTAGDCFFFLSSSVLSSDVGLGVFLEAPCWVPVVLPELIEVDWAETELEASDVAGWPFRTHAIPSNTTAW